MTLIMILHARLLTFLLNWSNDSKIGVNLYMHLPYSLISLTRIRSPLCRKKIWMALGVMYFLRIKKCHPYRHCTYVKINNLKVHIGAILDLFKTATRASLYAWNSTIFFSIISIGYSSTAQIIRIYQIDFIDWNIVWLIDLSSIIDCLVNWWSNILTTQNSMFII